MQQHLPDCVQCFRAWQIMAQRKGAGHNLGFTHVFHILVRTSSELPLCRRILLTWAQCLPHRLGLPGIRAAHIEEAVPCLQGWTTDAEYTFNLLGRLRLNT